MADGRMLSRRISRSNKVAALKTDTARMIYTWLIPYLDVEGRMEANVDLLKADIAPLLKHVTTRLLGSIIKELHAVGLIILYNTNGVQYLELTEFETHQKHLRKDREAPSRIPGPTPASLRSDAGSLPDEVPPNIREVKRREEKCASLFEIFWKEYPKKKSKGQAEKAWLRINPDEQLLETMISKIKQAKKSDDWMKVEGKYIPHPATWLNAKGWEDEIKQPSKPSNGATPPERMYVRCPSCHEEVTEDMLTEFACLKCEPTRDHSGDVAKITSVLSKAFSFPDGKSQDDVGDRRRVLQDQAAKLMGDST